MNKKILTFTALGVLLTSMTACGDTTEKVTAYIEKLDFEKAYNYYVDKIEDSKERDEADVEISSAMSKVYDSLTEQYISGDLDSDDVTYIKKLATAASFYSSLDYNNFLNDMDRIDSSTDAYENGMSAYEDENYTSAVSYFRMVYEVDSAHYSDAQDKITECQELISSQEIENIRSLITDGKYTEARQAINTLSGTDSSSADTLRSELETAVLSGVDEKVDSYFSNFDYDGAYSYLRNLNDEYGFESLTSRIDNLEDEFVSYSLSTAEEDAEANNYESASAVIQKAQEIVGEDNESLNAAYSEYRSHLPIYITDMEYMSCVNNVNHENNLKDNIGTLYHNGLNMDDDGWYHSGEGSAEYYIQGKYQTFSGTVAVPSGNESSDRSAYFEVYGDGTLLYTSPVMENTSFPETFSIDITGVKILKILYPQSNSAGYMATIYDGLLKPEGNAEAQGDATTQEVTAD